MYNINNYFKKNYIFDLMILKYIVKNNILNTNFSHITIIYNVISASYLVLLYLLYYLLYLLIFSHYYKEVIINNYKKVLLENKKVDFR